MFRRLRKVYPLKVWVTTILASSAILVIHAAINNSAGLDSVLGALALYVYVAFFGLALSVPSFIIYYLLFAALMNMNLSVRLIKFFLALLGIFTILLTFIIFIGYGQREFYNYRDMVIPFSYIFVLVICSWSYRIL